MNYRFKSQSRLGRLPSEIQQRIMEQSELMTLRDLSFWLKTTLGVTISQQAISKYLFKQRYREAPAEVAFRMLANTIILIKPMGMRTAEDHARRIIAELTDMRIARNRDSR